MNGIKLDYSKHCRLLFGSYVQVHDEPSPTNSPTARSIGAITLGPTGNIQGGYKFPNLRMGKKITRRNWTHLPMLLEVIERVNKICSAQGQPKLLTFQYRHGHEKSDPDPYFQPLDHEIKGVVYDEHIEDNNADHEDRNSNLVNQGEDEQDAAINKVGYPPEN